MAEPATLARPYANAAFALAKASQALDFWSRQLAVLASASAQRPVQALLAAPGLSAERKAARLAELCSEALDDAGRRFLQVLAHHGRLPLLAEVSRSFDALKAQEDRNLDVAVHSRFPLSESQAERLKAALQAKFGKRVTLAAKVDESLVGGARIRAGDKVIDGSVRGRLDKLAESLLRS